MCLLKLTSAYDEHVFHNASESTADANAHSSVPILIFIMCLNAKESKKIVSLWCLIIPLHDSHICKLP